MDDLNIRDVLKVIVEIAQSIRYRGLMLNERYLHHFFSHKLQDKYGLLDLTGDTGAIILHPESPTYKTQTGLLYGRYKKENGEYRPNPNGTAGFIDFAIGDYEKPDIGMEFQLKYGWGTRRDRIRFSQTPRQKEPIHHLNIIQCNVPTD